MTYRGNNIAPAAYSAYVAFFKGWVCANGFVYDGRRWTKNFDSDAMELQTGRWTGASQRVHGDAGGNTPIGQTMKIQTKDTQAEMAEATSRAVGVGVGRGVGAAVAGKVSEQHVTKLPSK